MTPRIPVDELVEQLRSLPTPIPAMGRSDGKPDPVEQRRWETYEQLGKLGGEALPALVRALRDPDVSMRRNVALALGSLAGSMSHPSDPRVDILPALPALITALEDDDHYVRAWAAQAIGEIGPDAVSAVPSLIDLLDDSDEGSRNSACIALRWIGPAAGEALPVLQQALSDPSADVRSFAQRAIDAIRAEPGRPSTERGGPSRDEPCPCGSGRKYEHCCAGGRGR